MKRQKPEKHTPAFESWDQVDQALNRIGVIDRTIKKEELATQDQMETLRQKLVAATGEFNDEKLDIENHIEDWVNAHKGEFSQKRTKELNFGLVGLRASTKLIIKNAHNIILALKRKKLFDCIVVKESVDKEALKAKPEKVIESVGATLATEDTMWYEVNETKIVETGS